MAWFVSALITGITAFAATNIDDILILMMFFAQVNDSFRPRHIVTGQYLGFAALLLACLPGFLGGLVLPKSWIGLLGILPIVLGIHHLLNQDPDQSPIHRVTENAATRRSKLAHFLHPKTYQVAVVTFVNGGDNIGVYVPLFASTSLPSLVVMVTVFMVLIAVWCAIAHYLAGHSAISPLFTRYLDRLVPFVLMGLGLYILVENGSHRLIPLFSKF